MSYILFNNSDIPMYGAIIERISDNTIKLCGIPENISGFKEYDDTTNEIINDYSDYTTVNKRLSLLDFQYSNNGFFTEQTQEKTDLKLNECYINEINELKQLLADSDYKIVKAYEYQITGKEPPYDIINLTELSEQRDGYRKRINELERNLKQC